MRKLSNEFERQIIFSDKTHLHLFRFVNNKQNGHKKKIENMNVIFESDSLAYQIKRWMTKCNIN